MSAAAFSFGAADPPPRAVGVAPLVDIVLLLICFYLIVAKVTADRDDPTIELPAMAVVLEDPAATGPVVNLRADGATLLNNQPVAMADLPGALAAAREAEAGETLTVRADRAADAADLGRVQAAAAAAGYTTLSLRSELERR